MCLLLESIQIRDGLLLNARYHQARMDSSSQELFGKRVKLDLSSDFIPSEFKIGIFKCRIVYNSKIESISFEEYIPKKINSLKLVYDNNISYTYKFADRSRLNELLKQKGSSEDILIVKNDKITDTSYSNVVFRKQNEYFTPSTFLLNGIKRQQLLENGQIAEMDLSVNDLAQMDSILLINSMLDLNSGVGIKTSSIIL